MLSDYIPSQSKIDSINQEIKKREEFIQRIIIEIEKWKNEMIKRTEQIKKILNEEINLFKKITFNFNKKYLNYNYINNFNAIYNYLRECNLLNINKINENLYAFCKEKNFYEKTSFLIIIFKNLEKEQLINFPFQDYSCDKKGVYLKDDYYLYSYYDKIIIKYYYKKEMTTVAEYNFNNNHFYLSFSEYSPDAVHISLFDNKIICFNYEKILILNYDLNQEKILLNEEIILKGIRNCFEIKKDHFLIVTYEEHILWVNKQQKIKVNSNI